NGFFLMVESASIDKQSHLRRPCGHIGEVLQLDEAVESALAFSKNNQNTLILVVADHGQAAQLVPQKSLFSALEIPIYSKGYFARVRTLEGDILGVNYGTNNFKLEEHTGVQVPLYASGSGSEAITSYLLQPDIFTIMARHLMLPARGSD
ncbi:MAG: alkaline phosphatase, partial [Proteobacteria bacterium]|nr:alkaline phosphatase [Pseudomonadota bacterium]